MITTIDCHCTIIIDQLKRTGKADFSLPRFTLASPAEVRIIAVLEIEVCLGGEEDPLLIRHGMEKRKQSLPALFDLLRMQEHIIMLPFQEQIPNIAADGVEQEVEQMGCSFDVGCIDLVSVLYEKDEAPFAFNDINVVMTTNVVLECVAKDVDAPGIVNDVGHGAAPFR